MAEEENLKENDVDVESDAIDEGLSEDDLLLVDGEEAETLEDDVYEYSTSDGDFWVSPEEFYEDCGCGLDAGCLTTCAEEAAFVEDTEEDQSTSPDAEDDGEDSAEDDDPGEIFSDSERSDAPDRVENDPREAQEDDEPHDTVSDDVDRTCFIATAAYADPTHPDVQFLREFRDQWLVKRIWGRLFVQIYWRVGPPAARFVDNRPVVAEAAKIIIASIVYALKRIW